MLSRQKQLASKKARRGFTLIELLVVISIIATLMSLILPAIQNAREAGRRTQCLNNIRNLTVAALNFASSQKSRLPALGYYPLDDDDADDSTPEVMIHGRSWVVELLPYMDQQGTYDRWDKASPWYAMTDDNGNGSNNADLADNLYIEALACPNDESAYQQAGGLSYVANGGIGDLSRNNITTGTSAAASAPAVEHSFTVEALDWDGSGSGTPDATDQKVTKATGVFWCEFASDSTTRNASASVGKIYDGSANTLMFGENINAGIFSWSDPNPESCGFFFPVTAASVNATTLGNVSAVIATSGSPAVESPAYPNEAKAGPEGTPYLNSVHPGIVVVSYCDGSAKTLNESVDESVYVRLITPDGTRLRTGIAAEEPLSADSF